MKPKNRVFCYDCGRPKLLFETEKKALNFIKFNADEINEYEYCTTIIANLSGEAPYITEAHSRTG